MAVLVIGGTGFIGSNIVKGLVERGEEVVAFDLVPNLNRLGEIKDKVEVVKGDILDVETLFFTIKNYNIDRIIHLAFYIDILGQEEHPLRPLKINCVGFNNVLEVARIMGVKRVVWASSVAVYGSPEYYPVQPVNEDAPTNPTTFYGACKVLDEYLGVHYAKKLGVDTIGLRPTVLYGPGRWYRGLSTFTYDLFVNPALGKLAKVDYGDQTVDWIYIKDVAKAFILACYAEESKHKIFNISGQVATVKEAAECVRKILPNADIVVEPGGKEKWPAYLDTSRAREELGYKPSYTLEEGFKEYIDIIREEAKRFPHLYESEKIK